METVQPPQSVTWLVHLDRAMWVGGVRGLMLQALHPMAMLGVWQNSNFQDDPFGRLRRTADFVGRVTFGSPEQADEIGRRVRGIHRQLRILHEGRHHRVDDPELLLWVHCAEVSSYLEVARRGGLGLSERQADRYLREQRRSATYVGLHEEDVPGSLAEMDAYFKEIRPKLRPVPEAVETVRFLLWPTLPKELRVLNPGKPLYFPFGALCYLSLPEWARRMYGLLPQVPQAGVTAGLRAWRLAMNSVPEPVHDRAFMPATRQMLQDARDRLGAAGYDMGKGLRGLTDPRRWAQHAA
ncbi:oxygenase MpaB family protein [Nonomuraea soli]|uniref:Uncharacterized protein (DUF2236 family) n=1 Tax=Nonomuraea soli TaxID=1032476 RepID=A0A7W0CRH2_9ACTN|nr:oxygenase MpaB family protein [Nonomuraea soli]MBA2895844.1 uncharacterized protein (DUF2236 family) [Nonomuraea soli]